MKSIKIGGNMYRVYMTKDENLGDAAADCDNQKHIIRIGRGAKPEAVRHFLLHEILHALNWEWEEKEIEMLAVMIEQVLVDNPHVTQLFLKNEDK